MKILSRGYSVTRHPKTGVLIRTVSDAKAGDPLEIIVSDGTILAETISNEKRKTWGI